MKKKILFVGGNDMNNGGMSGIVSLIGVLEPMLRIFVYIAIISVLFKTMQALNIYINKNSR